MPIALHNEKHFGVPGRNAEVEGGVPKKRRERWGRTRQWLLRGVWRKDTKEKGVSR